MAQERILDPQVMPRPAAARPMARPEDYGAGVAEAAGQLGETLHRAEVQGFQVERQLRANQEWADFHHAFALHRQNMDGIVRQMRGTAPAGGVGHRDGVLKANDVAQDGLLAGITEDSVRQRAQQLWDTYRTGLNDAEGGFEEASRLNKLAFDVGVARDTAANRIRNGGSDPAVYVQETKLGYEAIDALQAPDDVKAKLRREQDQTFAAAFLNHLNDTNPQAALALIDAGRFNEDLTPEQLDQARRGALVELRRVADAAQQEAAVAKSQWTEKVATVTELAAQGVDVSAELPALKQQAITYGDMSTAMRLEGLERDSAFARIYSAATPIQREQRMAELRAKPAPDVDEQRELRWLEEKGSALDAKFNADPAGFMASRGAPGSQPPAIDWNAPETLRARAGWQRAMKRAAGHMTLLTANEQRDLRARMTAGHAGYVEVMNALATFDEGPASAMAAREVAPDDRLLQQLVTLPERYRSMAMQGRDILKGQPQLLKIDSPQEEEAVAEATRQLHAALQYVPAEQRNAIIDSARFIAASTLSGRAEQLGESLWRKTLNMALGATGTGAERKGGLARWAGEDDWFLAPDGKTAAAFAAEVFRWVRDNPRRGPVNPDGSPANLRRAKPVAIGDGRYMFVAGSEAVVNAEGEAWIYPPESGK